MKLKTYMLAFASVLMLAPSCKKVYEENYYNTTNETVYTYEYYQKVLLDQKEITEDIRPPYLKKGDTVAVFAASNKVTKSELSAGIAKLKEWGLNVVEADNLYEDDGRYAGTQSQRILGLQKLIDNPNIKALFSARGGYGAAQVIPFLDLEKLKDQPKWAVGYSDVTALHVALNNLGIESIHGPMVNKMTDAESVETLRKALFGETVSYSFPTTQDCITGKGEGRLVGGNLSLIYSLGGTLFDLNAKDAILLIEDTGESNYHLDRMLTNLKLSGKLDCIKGLVVGEFTNMNQGSDKPINEIILSKVKDLNIPVMYGLGVGHGTPNYAVYMGRQAKLVVANDKATLTFE
ncbi:MAG: LD-carboxypeptidase [Paludibacteraceae bacterium]|nr:LD-carboxypeptidase [Paludibacteraceae bacterium]